MPFFDSKRRKRPAAHTKYLNETIDLTNTHRQSFRTDQHWYFFTTHRSERCVGHESNLSPYLLTRWTVSSHKALEQSLSWRRGVRTFQTSRQDELESAPPPMQSLYFLDAPIWLRTAAHAVWLKNSMMRFESQQQVHAAWSHVSAFNVIRYTCFSLSAPETTPWESLSAIPRRENLTQILRQQTHISILQPYYSHRNHDRYSNPRHPLLPFQPASLCQHHRKTPLKRSYPYSCSLKLFPVQNLQTPCIQKSVRTPNRFFPDPNAAFDHR